MLSGTSNFTNTSLTPFSISNVALPTPNSSQYSFFADNKIPDFDAKYDQSEISEDLDAKYDEYGISDMEYQSIENAENALNTFIKDRNSANIQRLKQNLLDLKRTLNSLTEWRNKLLWAPKDSWFRAVRSAINAARGYTGNKETDKKVQHVNEYIDKLQKTYDYLTLTTVSLFSSSNFKHANSDVNSYPISLHNFNSPEYFMKNVSISSVIYGDIGQNQRIAFTLECPAAAIGVFCNNLKIYPGTQFTIANGIQIRPELNGTIEIQIPIQSIITGGVALLPGVSSREVTAEEVQAIVNAYTSSFYSAIGKNIVQDSQNLHQNRTNKQGNVPVSSKLQISFNAILGQDGFVLEVESTMNAEINPTPPEKDGSNFNLNLLLGIASLILAILGMALADYQFRVKKVLANHRMDSCGTKLKYSYFCCFIRKKDSSSLPSGRVAHTYANYSHTYGALSANTSSLQSILNASTEAGSQTGAFRNDRRGSASIEGSLSGRNDDGLFVDHPFVD